MKQRQAAFLRRWFSKDKEDEGQKLKEEGGTAEAAAAEANAENEGNGEEAVSAEEAFDAKVSFSWCCRPRWLLQQIVVVQLF